ncbi:isochorismate synthase [Pseudoalteromonas sp. T1lg65]|uniref:isochorismate synthase n=1 Tax=Pseudoalteromonas sp. T1lg65 TaxID=2077101 RepID=UPI003F78E9BC
MLDELSALKLIITPDTPFDAKRHALFVSGEQCYITKQIHSRFKASIDNSEALVDKVNFALNQCQQDNAIAFGILPFCKSQQAEFIVAEQVGRYDKTLLSDWLALSQKHADMPTLQHAYHRQSQTHYENAIRKAKCLFSSKQLDKIVLGKQVDLTFTDKLKPELVLANLLQQSRSGFHFSFPTEQGATLMGVSPELLLRKQGDQLLSNPLAGSAKRTKNSAIEFQRKQALMNSKKDRYEHAVVLVEMSQVLKPWCHKLTIPSAPSLLSTATMWHLSTEVEAQLHDPNTHVLALANRLHPTPALCGKPTAAAYPWVQKLEGESRDFFSGIVGWCDKHGNGEWVVIIRSGEVKDNHARLFAGAGIVAASNPTSEWLETEAKLSTMLNALSARQQYQQLKQAPSLETA